MVTRHHAIGVCKTAIAARYAGGTDQETLIMTIRFLLVAGAAALMCGPAFAQAQPLPSTFDRVQSALSASRGPAHADGTVRVQSNISYFVPVAAGDDAAAEKEREKARAAIYETAAHECTLLLATLAKECRLVSLNSNVGAARNYGQAQQNGFSVNGVMSFQIVPK
jgi:hypothetical protein